MKLTFTIKATVDGMAGELAIEADKLEQIRAVLREMPKHGIQPAASFEFPRTPDGKPICPKHGVEMRLRSKQGDEWWSHRVLNRESGEEMYCRGYASVNSPGFDVPAEQAGDLDDAGEDDLDFEPRRQSQQRPRQQHGRPLGEGTRRTSPPNNGQHDRRSTYRH